MDWSQKKENMNDLKLTKGCPISLIIKEVQIKTVPRYNVLPIRLAKIQHSQLVRVQENRHFHILIQSLGKQFGVIYQTYKCVYLLVQQPYFWEFILQMNPHVNIMTYVSGYSLQYCL